MSDLVYINPLSEEVEASEFMNLGSLAEDMVYRLPGCADVMIRKTLQNVYREFCKITWALRSTTVSELVKGTSKYNVIIPSQSTVLRVVKVKKGTSVLQEGTQYRALVGSPAKIELLSVPTDCDEGVELSVESVCVPTRGAEDVPNWFEAMYGDALVSGALFVLFAMSGKPWTDESQAKMEGIKWRDALSDASAKSITSSQIGNKEINCINYGGML